MEAYLVSLKAYYKAVKLIQRLWKLTWGYGDSPWGVKAHPEAKEA
jgi:hypothetical protein